MKNKITIIGLSGLFFYILTQLLSFYGIGPEIYSVYLYFYAFLAICSLVLPITIAMPFNYISNNISNLSNISSISNNDNNSTNLPSTNQRINNIPQTIEMTSLTAKN